RTGREAVDQLMRVDPDVIVLDVEMPDLDGISALPLLLAKKPDLVVIMASTLTRRNAEISLQALALGAADYIPKPTTNVDVNGSVPFRHDVVEKIRQLGLRAKRNRVASTRASQPAKKEAAGATPAQKTASLALRPMPMVAPRVLLIGCSTGGPQALNTVIP